MCPILFFDPISIPVPRDNIYKRLGFRKGVTLVQNHQKKESERYIEEALSLIYLKGAGLRISVQKKGPSEIILPGNVRLESRKLAEFIGHCDEIVIMGATSGTAIMDAIEKDAAGRNVTRGVILDAAASEIVDAALDWIMAYFDRILRKESKGLLQKRFSAGYGDFSLENQKAIYNLLELDRLGVRITESCVLIPEKSVTAITGIKLLSEGNH